MGITCSQMNEYGGKLILDIERFPKLDIGNRTGATQYIDFININEESIV